MISNLFLMLNLFLLESMLSVDNAAVLAVMVKDLPDSDKPKALKWGIGGAFLFRGLAMVFASYIVSFVWLKFVGGAYLLYLAYGHFSPQKDTIEEGVDKDKSRIYKYFSKIVGAFWGTVILVEIMDMAFSIDNILAAVALSDNIWIILIGVFFGIIAMRFVAQWFVTLMQKYPSLENSAFVVIAILGLRLVLMGVLDYFPTQALTIFMRSHTFDLIFSAIVFLVFIQPIIAKKVNKAN